MSVPTHASELSTPLESEKSHYFGTNPSDMGLGSTAKKIQKVADTAEKLYAKLNELREQVIAIRDTLETTNERVERLETESAKQRALVEALAEERGIDVESALDDVETETAKNGTEVDEMEGDDGTTEAST
jgi:archaellum component FlaC